LRTQASEGRPPGLPDQEEDRMIETATTPKLDEVTGNWFVDPSHSLAEFRVKYMMIVNVKGRFDELEGVVDLKEPVEDSTIEVTFKTASISTSDETRDGHLRSPDFFDVETHPAMTFRSTRIERTSDAGGRVFGDLTIRGVTRPVELNVEFNDWTPKDLWGKQRLSFSGSTSINRADWDLTWNKAIETGGVLVGDRIDVVLEVSLVRE
jgi:polyisoprenoid-binding protein YceI